MRADAKKALQELATLHARIIHAVLFKKGSPFKKMSGELLKERNEVLRMAKKIIDANREALLEELKEEIALVRKYGGMPPLRETEKIPMARMWVAHQFIRSLH